MTLHLSDVGAKGPLCGHPGFVVPDLASVSCERCKVIAARREEEGEDTGLHPLLPDERAEMRAVLGPGVDYVQLTRAVDAMLSRRRYVRERLLEVLNRE